MQKIKFLHFQRVAINIPAHLIKRAVWKILRKTEKRHNLPVSLSCTKIIICPALIGAFNFIRAIIMYMLCEKKAIFQYAYMEDVSVLSGKIDYCS